MEFSQQVDLFSNCSATTEREHDGMLNDFSMTRDYTGKVAKFQLHKQILNEYPGLR